MAWKPAYSQLENFKRDMDSLNREELAAKYDSTPDKVGKFKRALKLCDDIMALYGDEADTRAPAQTVSGQETRRIFNAGTEQTISFDGTHISSLEELLEFCKVDLDLWEVVDFTINKWEMGFIKTKVNTEEKPEDGEPKVSTSERTAGSKPLFQVKARLKLRTNVRSARVILDEMFEGAAEYAPNYVPFERTAQQTDGTGRLLEIAIPDLHVGKLAWAPESGENYDIKIAEAVFNLALEDLVSRAICNPDAQIGRIVLPLGNDLLNIDTPENMTTSGTPQDSDSRYHKIFLSTCRMLRGAIDRLTQVADVDIVMVPGNHDRLAVFHVGEVLAAWYRNNEQVQVFNEPKVRKYYRFGAHLFMYTHGDQEKTADLPMIMARERKQDWAETEFRWVKLGHLHQKKVLTQVDIQEHFGVQIQRCPSLCATDEYHFSRGYVGNMRRAEAHIYHPTKGLENFLTFYPPRAA